MGNSIEGYNEVPPNQDEIYHGTNERGSVEAGADQSNSEEEILSTSGKHASNTYYFFIVHGYFCRVNISMFKYTKTCMRVVRKLLRQPIYFLFTLWILVKLA